MSKYHTLHNKARKHLAEIESIIDQLKEIGPDPRDGDNALMNIRDTAEALARRANTSR